MGNGKGGGGRQQDSLDQTIYDQFYQAGKSGAAYNWMGAPDREIGARMGYEAGLADRPVEMPDFTGMLLGQMEMMNAQRAEADAKAQAAYEAQQEQLRIKQGTRDRDDLYGAYMDAAGTAVDFINSEISKEQANAALLGIDYAITDEQKSTRINDYFATIWGAGEQSQLEALMGEFGNPEGFSGFSVTRGDGSKYAGTEASETQVATSQGIRPSIVTEDDEEGILGSSSTILGE